jgi:hypothetical protein
MSKHLYEFDGKLYTIETYHAYPPIPIRDQDWCAYYEGEEEYGNYGWGCTEEDAIQDLKDSYEPEEWSWNSKHE